MSGVPVTPAILQHRRLVVWWLTSAGILLVILVAFAGYYAVSTVASFVHGGYGCLPGDFPRYTNAVVVEVDFSLGNPVQGDTKTCRMRLSSRDGYESVNTFFRKRLNSDDWSYRSYLEDSAGSILAFYLRARPLTYGSVTMQKQAGGTPFEIELFS